MSKLGDSWVLQYPLVGIIYWLGLWGMNIASECQVSVTLCCHWFLTLSLCHTLLSLILNVTIVSHIVVTDFDGKVFFILWYCWFSMLSRSHIVVIAVVVKTHGNYGYLAMIDWPLLPVCVVFQLFKLVKHLQKTLNKLIGRYKHWNWTLKS